MLTVVGGVYHERVARSDWDEFYGSAGRAAEAIVELGSSAELVTYLDAAAAASLGNRNWEQRYRIRSELVRKVAGFDYVHGLAPPDIDRASNDHGVLSVEAENVVSYGMIEGDAVITANFAVYDPQNFANPKAFGANGSTANHLALILNRHEAALIAGSATVRGPEELARELARRERAEVVIMKGGPLGALVLHNGTMTTVPAYQTDTVFKIGSGDVFVAVFAQGWIEEGLSPAVAAERASRATAYYVQKRRPPNAGELRSFHPKPVTVGAGTTDPVSGRSNQRKVYLAGPFFTMGQFWVIEEARRALLSMGLAVHSPYHMVGPGAADVVVKEDLRLLDDCDLVLAIGDGMDAGTVFEVGYAKAQRKPVVFYAENEVGEDLKMFEGSHCQMVTDFPTAIYRTVWEALAL